MKYRNVPVTVAGRRFDSKAEAARYQELRLLEQAGEIEALRIKPAYELQPAFRDRSGKHQAAIRLIPDFRYIENGVVVCEDVKGGRGTITRAFTIKWKLAKFRWPGIDWRIVT